MDLAPAVAAQPPLSDMMVEANSRENMAIIYVGTEDPANEGTAGESMANSGPNLFPSCDPLGLETIVQDETSANLLKNKADRSQALSYEFKDGLHTFSVPMVDDGGEGHDPTFVLKSVSFELAPVAMTPQADGSMIQEFTIVPAGSLPMSHVTNQGQEEEEVTSSPEKAKTAKGGGKRKVKLKRRRKNVCKTELAKARVPRTLAQEEEDLDLNCEWASCDFNTSNIRDYMDHVSGHVDKGIPISAQSHHEGAIVDEEEEAAAAVVMEEETPKSKVFGCLWRDCGHTTPSSVEIVRHVHFHTFHTKLKSHGRHVLTVTGINPCALDSGQRNVLPDLTDPFICFWQGCLESERSFSQALHYYWHVQWHSEEYRGMQSFKCVWKDCSAAPKSVAKLKEHLRIHSQERVVACPVCGGLFANRSKFFDHCKRQDTDCQNAVKCAYCTKLFPTERLLRDHTRSHINQFKCPMCDMTCPSPSNLVSHMSYRHFQVKSFACPKKGCPYKAKTDGDLQKHCRTHLNPSYACPYPDCKYVAKGKANATAHIAAVHEKVGPKYGCHLCDKRFARGHYLTKHLMAVHKLRWPSGHTRFRYKQDDATGLYALQTVRFESVELIEKELGAILPEDGDDDDEAAADEEDKIMEEISSSMLSGSSIPIQDVPTSPEQ